MSFLLLIFFGVILVAVNLRVARIQSFGMRRMLLRFLGLVWLFYIGGWMVAFDGF